MYNLLHMSDFGKKKTTVSGTQWSSFNHFVDFICQPKV